MDGTRVGRRDRGYMLKGNRSIVIVIVIVVVNCYFWWLKAAAVLVVTDAPGMGRSGGALHRLSLTHLAFLDTIRRPEVVRRRLNACVCGQGGREDGRRGGAVVG